MLAKFAQYSFAGVVKSSSFNMSRLHCFCVTWADVFLASACLHLHTSEVANHAVVFPCIVACMQLDEVANMIYDAALYLISVASTSWNFSVIIH